MPLYEYECESCGRRFEVIQKFSDPPADVCKHCGSGPVRRLLSSPAIQFKGSGWYITDYAKKSSVGDSSSSKSKSGDGGGDTAKSDAPKTETKSETPKSDTPTKS